MLAARTALWTDDSGQGSPEYGLLLAAIVALVVSAMFLFRGDVLALFDATGDYITSQL
jgi:Flp pilus assembly pilin Flp